MREQRYGIHVRLPASLHERLRAISATEEISLNALIITLISTGLVATDDLKFHSKEER